VAVCVRLSSAAARARSPATCAGVPGAPRYHQAPVFETKELGEIDMVSLALATVDLVTHDDAQPGFPPVHLLPPLIEGELLELPGSWLPPRSANCSADQR
jgi:hypothetical protein